MGYKTASLVQNFIASAGGTWSVTLDTAASVGDIYVALASWDQSANRALTSVTSPNMSWQIAEEFDHIGNNQNFEIWVGRVTTAFSANTESVTATLEGTDSSYRDLSVLGFTPESGYEFPASGYFADASHVSYNASENPTSTDGFSTTPILGSVNAKWLLIGWLAVEATGGDGQNAGSGTTLTQAEEWSLFGSASNVSNVGYKTYDGSTNQAVTATYNRSAEYMTSLCGIALKMTQPGGPPFARPYSPDAAGMRTVLRM